MFAGLRYDSFRFANVGVLTTPVTFFLQLEETSGLVRCGAASWQSWRLATLERRWNGFSFKSSLLSDSNRSYWHPTPPDPPEIPHSPPSSQKFSGSPRNTPPLTLLPKLSIFLHFQIPQKYPTTHPPPTNSVNAK